MLLIYSHKLTNRLQYIFKTIFTDVLHLPIHFTDNLEKFQKYSSSKINYSTSVIDTELFFQSSSILFENGIREQDITVSKIEDSPIFFPVEKDSALPFDPFAASFYLITRYEEYLPHIRDQHDRFLASESLAFQNDFLETPIVNHWINEIEIILKNKFPDLVIPSREFNYISTIDIDNAYAYKYKGLIRAIAGLTKAIFKTKDFHARLKVLFNKEKDPYDTYNYQFELHKKYNLKPIYFFLLGDYAKNDKNISVKNKQFQSLIKSISDYYSVGIHPSYSSNKDHHLLTKEVKRLRSVMHKNVTKSRQHFLKLSLPDTYRNLINNDIEEDYTMGYAEEIGFRASICSPYYFYDLDMESETKLKIIPFSLMEASFQYYKDTSIEETTQQINQIINTVRKVNGTFVSVWHNESLSEKGIWIGWKTVYEKMLQELISVKEIKQH